MGESQTFQNDGPADESSRGRSSNNSMSSPGAPESQRQNLLSSEGEQDSCSSSEAMMIENLASSQTSPKAEHPQEGSSSCTSNSSRVSEENGVNQSHSDQKKKQKKPKSEASVAHDKEKGVCTCKRCGWIYPNPHPSARLRREHRRHCGKFQDVHAWLSLDKEQQEEEEETGEAAEDVAMKDSEEEDVSSNQSTQQEETSEVAQEQHELEKGSSSASQSIQREDEPATSEGERQLQQDDKAQSSEHQEPSHTAGKGTQDTASIGHLHLKEVDKHSTSSSDITQENDANSQEAAGSKTTEYDLEKILKEQTSHHLLCPNCGSCITKRVILRKRKRTGGLTVSTGQQEKQPKLEIPAEIEQDRGVGIEQAFSAPAPADEEGDEVEAWSCLACLAVFFRKVREALDEPVDRAQHFSCLPYLLPDFHWDGDGSPIIQDEEEPQLSRCLPIEFPWRRATEPSVQEEADETPGEVETSTPPESTALPVAAEDISEQRESSSCFPIALPSLRKPSTEVESHDEEEQQVADRFSCMPILLPTYWGPDEPASLMQEPDSAEMNESKAGLNCIPDLISWTTRKGYEHEPIPEQVHVEETKFEPAKEEQAVEEAPPEPKLETGPEEDDVESEPAIEFKSEPRDPEHASPEEAETKPALLQTDGEGMEESTNVPADESCNCIPISIPKYSWGSQKVAPVNEVQNDRREASLNCIPVLFPPFTWDGDGEYVRLDEKKEDIPPAGQESNEEKQYITKETRIQAWIKTITSVVTVRPARKQTDAVQIGDETSFLDMTVTQKTDGRESKATTDALVSAPSTGWAIYDQMHPSLHDEEEIEDDEVKLIDNRRRPQKVKELEQQAEIQEVDQTPAEQPAGIQEAKDKVVPPQPQLDIDLRQPPLTSEEETKDLDVEAILSAFVEQKPSGELPVSTTVSVRGSDSVIEITGDDTKQVVEAALGIATDLSDLTQVLPEAQPEPVQEYVKSIVYGGLDVTLTSLAIVSSGAGAGTKTINVVAMSIANLVAGWITLLYSVRTLYKTNRQSFHQYVGQKLWLNGGIAVISFIVFGCIAPLTYALSFRAEDDQDYKFVATAAASLGCLFLMALGKAYVQKEGYLATIVSLLVTGFAASVAGYFAGGYVKRWLQKLGFDTDEAPPAPPATPSPPWPLMGLNLPGGRRGGASM